MENIYQTLMQLPLFQGVSRAKLLELVEKTRFHFLKYEDGETVASRSTACTHLKFLLSGSIRYEMSTYDGKVKLSQTLHAPDILAPDHLFGRSTHYPGNYYAVGSVGMMQIDKSTFMTLMQDEPIFLINLLNILSRRSQKNEECLMSMSTGDLRERLSYWILNLTSRNATQIRINARQRDLYSYFGVQRTVLLNTLAEMKQEKIIDYTVNEVNILDRRALHDILLEDIEFMKE